MPVLPILPFDGIVNQEGFSSPQRLEAVPAHHLPSIEGELPIWGGGLMRRYAQQVAEGRTNRDISRELNLCGATGHNCLFRIFNKLGT